MKLRLLHVLFISTIFMPCCSVTRQGWTPFSFDEFLSAFRSSPDDAGRNRELENFWAKTCEAGTPLIARDGHEVVFLYRGKGDSISLVGDMTTWAQQIPLTRLDTTDLFYLRMSIPVDARLDYEFETGGGSRVLDPCNPDSSVGGFGARSELAMPGFRRAPELEEPPSVPKGSLSTVTHESAALGYRHAIHVYLPPGYEDSANRYPVAYFQDGADYLRFARAVTVLNNLVVGGSIQPVIGVFVVPPTGSEHNRVSEYALNSGYVRFFVSELVPFIDSLYRTIPNPPHRLVIGPSVGGLISLYVGLLHPEVFGQVASQSGYLSCLNDSIITLCRTTAPRTLRVYADVGTFETAVGGRPGSDGNLLLANRRFRDALQQQGYSFEYREFPDGHSWGRWRNELPSILRLFFSWRD